MCFHDLQKQMEFNKWFEFIAKVKKKNISQDLFQALDMLFLTPLFALCYRVVLNQCLSISPYKSLSLLSVINAHFK